MSKYKTKNYKKTILIISLIFLIIFFGVGIAQVKIYKLLYPKKYAEYIYKYSTEYSVDSDLVFAIIKAESNFDSDAKSSQNAIGLMQILNPTAEELASKLKMQYNPDETLLNPEENIKMGVKYFSELYNLYGNIELALCAYNAGIGNVNSWIDKGIIKDDGSDMENIPVSETNMYVRKVLKNYRIYKELY